MPRSTNHPFKPLKPGKTEQEKVSHADYKAVQYEFYIPAAIWSHDAVEDFRLWLQGTFTQSATVLKTALGLWEADEEDTNIYRMICKPQEEGPTDINPGVRDQIRHALQDRIGQMMADLAAWYESYQEAFLFTESDVHVSISTTVKPKRPKPSSSAARRVV